MKVKTALLAWLCVAGPRQHIRRYSFVTLSTTLRCVHRFALTRLDRKRSCPITNCETNLGWREKHRSKLQKAFKQRTQKVNCPNGTASLMHTCGQRIRISERVSVTGTLM